SPAAEPNQHNRLLVGAPSNCPVGCPGALCGQVCCTIARYRGCGGEIERRRWWRVDFDQCADLDESDAADQIRALLEDSIRLHMRSDVPFGAYLSGGVDSSSVVALLARLGASKIKTFSLVYDDNFRNKEEDQHFARVGGATLWNRTPRTSGGLHRSA